MIWNTDPATGPVGTLAIINDVSPIGTWTVKFENNTSITLTTPSGTSTNFAMPTEAALFADPLYVYLGSQPNQLANIGQAVTCFAIPSHGRADALGRQFLRENPWMPANGRSSPRTPRASSRCRRRPSIGLPGTRPRRASACNRPPRLVWRVGGSGADQHRSDRVARWSWFRRRSCRAQALVSSGSSSRSNSSSRPTAFKILVLDQGRQAGWRPILCRVRDCTAVAIVIESCRPSR